MVVIDVETTGVDPKKSAMVSIGAVDFSSPEREFYAECRPWDGAHIHDEALAVNGFTREDLFREDRKSLEEVMREFAEWIEPLADRTLAGHNPSFDRGFVNESLRRSGIEARFAHRTIDSHSLAFASFLKSGIDIPLKNNHTDINLDAVLVHAGLPEEPKPHNALTGARMEAEAFSRLIYGKNLLPEFAEYPVPDYLS